MFVNVKSSNYVHIEFRLHLIKARNLGVCKVNDKKIPIQDLKFHFFCENIGANLILLGYRRLKHTDLNDFDVNWSQNIIMRLFIKCWQHHLLIPALKKRQISF